MSILAGIVLAFIVIAAACVLVGVLLNHNSGNTDD